MLSNQNKDMNSNFINEIGCGDEKFKSGEINLQVNQKNKKTKYIPTFENYMTEYETKEIGHIIQIIPLFLDSVIDMLNQIIVIYECNKKLFDNQKNNDIIFYVIELEKKNGKTIFEALINLKFKELYDYFIHNGTVVTWGWYIYDLSDIFKTLVDVTKDIDELKNKEYNLDLLDKMEIETINLEDSKLTFI